MVNLPQLDEVVTPALVVDRGRLLANVQSMAERSRSLGVALRPHAKTHKSPSIAALQRENGAKRDSRFGAASRHMQTAVAGAGFS